MKRREFIVVVGGVAAWPLAAYAQQPAMPVIGILRSTSLAVSTPMVMGFRQVLTAAGFTEGQNVTIEYRYADNQLERLPGDGGGVRVAAHGIEANLRTAPHGRRGHGGSRQRLSRGPLRQRAVRHLDAAAADRRAAVGRLGRPGLRRRFRRA